MKKFIDVRAALKDGPPDASLEESVAVLAEVGAWTPAQAEDRLLGAIAEGVVTVTGDGDSRTLVLAEVA